MNGKKILNLRKCKLSEEIFVFSIIFFLISFYNVSYVVAGGQFKVHANIRFNCSSGSFVFPYLVYTSHIVASTSQDWWKFYDFQLSTETMFDSVTFSLGVKDGHLTVQQVVKDNSIKATLTVTKTATVKLKISKFTSIPTRIIIDDKAYTHPETSLTDFNSAPYTTWYWHDQTSTLYIKVAPLSPASIIVEWLEALEVAPPPVEVEKPPPIEVPEVPPTIIEQIRETVQTALTFLAELSPATKILLIITVITAILITLYKRT